MSTQEDAVGTGAAEAETAGVVLAAGAGARMGAGKPLMDDGGEPLVHRLVESLRAGGCEPVLVVAGGKTAADVDRVATAAGARVVHNPDPASEQLDSLRLALRQLDAGVQAAVVTPVDRPGLLAATVARLIEAHRRTGAPLVIPTWLGKPGHPALFARSLFAELMEGDLPDGARTVIARHGEEAVRVEVADPGVPVDLDTPEDVARWQRRRGHRAD
jgi:CTP:molybdopterin cytidylyltransferase MocA